MFVVVLLKNLHYVVRYVVHYVVRYVVRYVGEWSLRVERIGVRRGRVEGTLYHLQWSRKAGVGPWHSHRWLLSAVATTHCMWAVCTCSVPLQWPALPSLPPSPGAEEC